MTVDIFLLLQGDAILFVTWFISDTNFSIVPNFSNHDNIP